MNADGLCVASVAEEAALRGTSPTVDRNRYLEYTEGRDSWVDPQGQVKKYGWCGDFITWVLSQPAIAVRRGSILNRAELNGKWMPGDTLARFDRWAKNAGASHTYGEVVSNVYSPSSGDIVILNTPKGGHICFFKSWISGTAFRSIDGNGPGGITAVNTREFKAGNLPTGVVSIYEIARMQQGSDSTAVNTLVDTPPLTRAEIADGGNGTDQQIAL